MKNEKITALMLLFFFLIFLDQCVKYIIRQSGGFYICNQNLAFGISKNYLLFFLPVIFLLFLWKKESLKTFIYRNYLPLIIILSGGFSNLVDRIRFGCVIDFIDLKFWPVFNLADIFIVLGSLVFILKNKK